MLFQGQEFLEDGYFHDDDPLDWSKASTYSGILQLYTDLIALRLNKTGVSAGLSGAFTNFHHVNDSGKVAAYHRWGVGGTGNDIVIVMNFGVNSLDTYRIGFPYEGDWFMVFNTDSTEYSPDYIGIGHDTTAVQYEYDGMAYSGVVNLEGYSMQIFSRVNDAEDCIGDLTGDGLVNVSDILAIISDWGTPYSDITGDTMTNVSDLLVVIGEFGPCQ